MLSRRGFLLAGGGLSLGAVGWGGTHAGWRIFTPYSGSAEDFWERASADARALVAEIFDDLGERPIHDLHVHLVGLGTQSSGAYVNPKFFEGGGLFDRAKLEIYLRASGIRDERQADAQYVERMVELARGFRRPVALHVLALDHHYRIDGELDLARTEFYLPNHYCIDTASEHPALLRPVASIHPGRADALGELERCAQAGVRMLKWLPNGQRIDPLDPANDAFYDRMVEYDMLLLSHTGIELAIEASEDQELGNPLRLRRPLERGVRVIAAHCATLGESRDLDHGGRSTSSFELFLRLMDDAAYRGRLFGELSAVPLFNRRADVLRVLLERTALHPRLVNGSDYPLSAIPFVLWPAQLAVYGHLEWDRLSALAEIQAFNPLLFELAVKRSLRGPSGERFPAEVFTAERLPGIGA